MARAKVSVTRRRVMDLAASVEVPDRQDEIIDLAGLDTTDFDRNPVALLQHDAGKLPIARVENLRRKLRHGKPAILIDLQFPAEGTSAQSDEVFGLFRDGVLGALSVGVLVKERRKPTPAERRAGVRGVISRSELIEISAVSIPANQLATASLAKALRHRNPLWVALRSALDLVGPDA